MKYAGGLSYDDSTYKTVVYVRGEVESLAEQLAAMV
jgi:hypothetical protein